MATADWYFDFVSPFSYLQLMQFDTLPATLEIRYRPVLFAGLLKHWGHKGPAEIPAKRRHTYRFCQWYANRHGIPLHFPPAHPFNSLAALRLAIALECEPGAIRTIFETIYRDGADLADKTTWVRLEASLDVADLYTRVKDPSVKEELRRNTDWAIAAGIFGVPTFACDGELFWGVDSTELFVDYLTDPERFAQREYQRLAELPVGAIRGD